MMPWNQVKPMDEKIRCISDHLNRVFTFTELYKRYHIGRKTSYKWVHRYEEDGAAGLEDRARSPRWSPSKVPTEIAEAILFKHPAFHADIRLVLTLPTLGSFYIVARHNVWWSL
jgi:hypothetical protein